MTERKRDFLYLSEDELKVLIANDLRKMIDELASSVKILDKMTSQNIYALIERLEKILERIKEKNKKLYWLEKRSRSK